MDTDTVFYTTVGPDNEYLLKMVLQSSKVITFLIHPINENYVIVAAPPYIDATMQIWLFLDL